VLRTPLGRALDGVARRCLAKNPNSRFGSAAELRDLFERLATEPTNLPGMTSTVLATPGASRWRRWATAAALVGVAMLAAGLMHLRARSRRPPSASAPAAAVPPRVVRPEPQPDPEPAPPARVELSFVSDPQGAEVRDMATGELLGKTPLRRAEPALGQVAEYHLTLPGYAPRRERVLLTADPPMRTVGGPLQRREIVPQRPRPPRRDSKAAARPDGKPLKESTLNPFSR
jgi:serine/threonine-protein kinase